MGIFDVFKSKNPIEDVLTTLHCINGNEWTDAGKGFSPKELIKQSKSLDDDEFINYIKKSPRYLKLENHFEINEARWISMSTFVEPGTCGDRSRSCDLRIEEQGGEGQGTLSKGRRIET